MSLWLAATLFAAAVQSIRFLLQKRLSTGGAAHAALSPAANTFARFVWAPPIVGAGLAAWWLWGGGSVPAIGAGFWPFAAAGALSQILATICVVALFAHRNFAVGIAFSKTTVLMTVGTGFVLLGETVGPSAFLAMLVGFGGVLILSLPAGAAFRPFNRASALGLGSGALFSISAVGYRGASLAVQSDVALERAALTLVLVTALQTLMLLAWLAWRDRAGLRQVFRDWRRTLPVGVTSLLGSLGWFTAYTLQTAALVNAVAQVELILSMLISRFALGERQTRREIAGIILVGVSVVGLILLRG